MPFSQIIPPLPSPTESKRLFYTCVSLLLSHTQWVDLLSLVHYFSLKGQRSQSCHPYLPHIRYLHQEPFQLKGQDSPQWLFTRFPTAWEVNI